MKRQLWTQVEIAAMRQDYPDTPTPVLARRLGRSLSSVYGKAGGLGLVKSVAFMASQNSGRIQRGRTDPRMVSTQFPKGHVPFNKGLRRPGWAPGRMAETQFKKGEMSGAAQHNYVSIGSTRIVYGNLEKKITDDPGIYPAARWRPVHRLVWEAAHGPMPKGHILVFKPGMHTTAEAEITLDRIECITRAENMRRNTIHRYPKDVVRTVQQMNWLQRRIRKTEKQLEETT